VQQIAAGSKVLDVGAGPAPYRDLFLNCEFKTHDFMQYNGYKSGTEGKYASIDYVSDVTAIPVEDASFDVILCTEVLEHVPEPSAALKEMVRIVSSGRQIAYNHTPRIRTAPTSVSLLWWSYAGLVVEKEELTVPLRNDAIWKSRTLAIWKSRTLMRRPS
jgi:SAM-dependent methyltransferase